MTERAALEQDNRPQADRASLDAIEVMQEIGKTLQRLCIARHAQGKPPIEPYSAALGTAVALGFQIGFVLADQEQAEAFYEAITKLGKQGIARGQQEAMKLAVPEGSA